VAKKKRIARAIIRGHLEKVGSGIFEKYQEAITSLITGKQGVYALYRRQKLYYIGLASNLKGRIRHHLKDKHKGKWDWFSLYIIQKEDHIREVEALLVRIAEPEGNRQKGKLKRSSNLRNMLYREIKQIQNKERDDFFEQERSGQKRGRIRRRKGKVKARTRKTSERPLKGVFPKGKVLYAKYKGKEYKAWTNRTGRIRYQGRWYDSPSAAAQAIIEKGAVNGWRFWKYTDKEGNRVVLNGIRK